MPSYDKTAFCPECGAKVTLKKRPSLGLIVTCRNCHTKLEVIDTIPLEFDWAFEDADDDLDDYRHDYEEDMIFDDYESQ